MPGGRAACDFGDSAGPTKRNGGVVFEEVKHRRRIGLQGRAGRERGPLEVDRIVVPAKCERPAIVGVGPAAGAGKILPGQPSFGRPAGVGVGPAVERAVQLHGGRKIEIAVGLEAFVSAGAAARQEHVEGGAGRVDLELIIARLVEGRLEEQLDNVIVPGHAVMFFDVGIKVRVVHLGKEIQVFAVPEQSCPGGGAGLIAPLSNPGHAEIVDHLGQLPGRLVGAAIDDDRLVRKSAFVVGPGRVGRFGRRRRPGGRFGGGRRRGCGGVALRFGGRRMICA